MFPAEALYVVVESRRGYSTHEVCQLEPCDAYFEPFQTHACFNALQKTLQQHDIKLEEVLHLRSITV